MNRLLIALLVAALATFYTGQSMAQYSDRAYAPENIGQLPVSDQIRVIEKEYREQSRGRELPDDQLDFYLDQVRYSRWSFSQIKNDIASSLRGSNNWRPPTGGDWQARSVICSSNDGRYQECSAPFRGHAQLEQNISRTRCEEGRNWGSYEGVIWVDGGCRGRFVDGGNNWNQHGSAFRCESDKNRYRECQKPNNGYVELVQQLSKTACVEGRTWGQKSNTVWVSGGCRGEFNMRGNNRGRYGNGNDYGYGVGNGNDYGYGYGNGSNYNYLVTCTSDGSRLRTCPWDIRRGTPRVVERLSKSGCEQGRDWGYDRGNIWVNNGCRARFGTR